VCAEFSSSSRDQAYPGGQLPESIFFSASYLPSSFCSAFDSTNLFNSIFLVWLRPKQILEINLYRSGHPEREVIDAQTRDKFVGRLLRR